MTELVYDSDNGIIALALQMYVQTANEMGGDQRLIDRATELEFIFKNKPTNEKYEWPEVIVND
jgi:hypothetical protein